MKQFYTSVQQLGSNILVRGYENGKAVQRKVPYGPTYYEASQNPDSLWKSLQGEPLEPIQFNSIKAAKDYYKLYSGVSGKKVHGMNNFVAQYINEVYPGQIEFDRSLINVTSIDIEVQSDEGFPFPEDAKFPIISIAMKNNIDNTYYVWGLKEYDVHKSIIDVERLVYRHCKDEEALLASFVDHWKNNCPDVITGWNVKFFDIPYIVNRITNTTGIKLAKDLSPFKFIKAGTIKMMNREDQYWELFGVQTLDYMDLFKKFGYSFGPQESYSLDHISSVVLGERKLSYEEHSNLYTLYKEDHQKFIDYNIRDVELIERLEDKIGLITLAMVVAYKAGINYKDCMGTVGVWDSIIFRDLHMQNIAVPPNEHDMKEKYPGGYVKEPQVGLHNWVCSFDLNSLYPSIIMQYNMSPETIIGGPRDPQLSFRGDDYIKNVDNILKGGITNTVRDTALATNGVRYSTKRVGVIPRIIEDLYAERVGIKKEMLHAQQEKEGVDKNNKQAIYNIEKKIAIAENRQMAIKILLNSLYGAHGSQYFRYFNMNTAEAITTTGQATIRWAEQAINGYLNKLLETDHDYIIAIDTDSIYVDMAELVLRVKPNNPVAFLDKVCAETLEKVLERAYNILYESLGGRSNKMVMAREAIADRGIWTAKKRYILNVHNNEGVQYKTPKLKIMGIEAVKSSTPAPCRQALRDIFKTIIAGSESDTQDEIATFKAHFKSLPAHEVAFPRGVSNITKWIPKSASDLSQGLYGSELYMKGTPIHVRGTILYNNAIKQYKNLAPINNGEKIKFLYIMKPNPIHENVISFQDYLPKELKLDEYVDYELQFEKAFVKPIKPVLDAIGWDVEASISLEDFF